jgi:surface protein
MGQKSIEMPKSINHSMTFTNIHLNNFGYYNLNGPFYGGTILWIMPTADNEENSEYQQILKKINFKVFKFTNIDECIEKLKKIKFEKTFVIVSGSYSKEFFIKLEGVVNELKVIPKNIIFTSNKRYIEIKQNIINFDKYDLFDINLVFDVFNPILEELKIKREYIIGKNNLSTTEKQKNNFIFDYIKESNELIFLLYFMDSVEAPNQNEIKDFNKFLLKEFGNNKEMENLIEQLLLKAKIPIQILVKYYLHAYTLETNFYKYMNTYLIQRLGVQYDPYIKLVYYGLKQNYISSCANNKLYRGSIITKFELKYIEDSLKKKKENLPGCICFNKSFLSTSLDREIAERFLNKIKSNNEEYVIFTIHPNEKINKGNITNVDIQEFSFYEEKEILFFPYSRFEITNIQKNKKGYFDIDLVHLGKYKEKIKNIGKIPETKFVTTILKTNIIDKIDLQKEANKFSFDLKNYIPPELKMGYIIATYEINPEDLNKKIQIINYTLLNKKELQDICEIYLKNEKQNFSFTKSFISPGKYKFKIVFNQLLKNACNLFYKCKSLISLDLKHFKTNYITDMSDMFNGCSRLKSLDLSGFKTKEVIYMNKMFYDCKSLKTLELSELNTINVKTMKNMFANCTSLTFLNLSNFNTKKVSDMSHMFENCSSLFCLNISSFDTSNVKFMHNMFSGCSSLDTLNLANFIISKNTNINNMLSECKLKIIYISKSFSNMSNEINNMFTHSTCKPNILLEFQKIKVGSFDRRYSCITSRETYKKFYNLLK